MGRPIWTHELASKKVWAEIKEATREDFNRLCRETSSEAIPIEWLRMWFTKNGYLSGMTLMDKIELDWEKENGNI